MKPLATLATIKHELEMLRTFYPAAAAEIERVQNLALPLYLGAEFVKTFTEEGEGLLTDFAELLVAARGMLDRCPELRLTQPTANAKGEVVQSWLPMWEMLDWERYQVCHACRWGNGPHYCGK